MTGKSVYFGIALLGALLAGCSANQPIPPEPQAIDPVFQERCYVMDKAEQQKSGYAILAEDNEFFFQPDCEKHRFLEEQKSMDSAEDAKSKSSETNPIKKMPDWLTASEGKADKANCIYDKMSAGEPGLEPCPWEGDGNTEE